MKFAVQKYILRLYLMIPIFFPIGAAGKKYVSLDLPRFLKMPKGRKVALIGLTIWSTSRDYSIKKN